jgi:hypothetical protein
VGSFDNDAASDWLYDLEGAEDAGVILAALRAVTESGEDLGARACCDALAAAEVVAALKGQALAWLPENARRWVDAHRTLDASALVIQALLAVQRVRAASELRELWDGSRDAPAWHATLDDLAARLRR